MLPQYIFFKRMQIDILVLNLGHRWLALLGLGKKLIASARCSETCHSTWVIPVACRPPTSRGGPSLQLGARKPYQQSARHPASKTTVSLHPFTSQKRFHFHRELFFSLLGLSIICLDFGICSCVLLLTEKNMNYFYFNLLNLSVTWGWNLQLKNETRTH